TAGERLALEDRFGLGAATGVRAVPRENRDAPRRVRVIDAADRDERAVFRSALVPDQTTEARRVRGRRREGLASGGRLVRPETTVEIGGDLRVAARGRIRRDRRDPRDLTRVDRRERRRTLNAAVDRARLGRELLVSLHVLRGVARVTRRVVAVAPRPHQRNERKLNR